LCIILTEISFSNPYELIRPECEMQNMSLEGIRVIVFDMGGVLYDTPRETIMMTRFILKHFLPNASASLSVHQIANAVSEVDRMFDEGLVENNVDPHWLPTYEDSIEYDRLILESLGIQGNLDSVASVAHRKWVDAEHTVRPKFMEQCREVLSSLRANGYKMGIASNRRNNPVPRLASDNILSFFDVVEYSCVPGYRKPSPYMLLQIARRLDINPRKCAYIGDKVDPDVEAAIRAEFIPILLVWCSPEEAEKAPRGTNVIQHINELVDLF
jgi:phosphoglycolate phosphatase-like HAD superfamily hydrolase